MNKERRLHITKFISKREISFIIISVLFYAFSIFLSGIYAGNFGSSFSQNKLQNHVNDIEESMDFAAQQYSEILQLSLGEKTNISTPLLPKKIIEQMDEQGIHVFVYVKDSCIAWSDNDYVIEASKQKNAFYVHKSDIGLFLVKDVKLKEYSLRFAYRVYQSFNISNEYLESKLNDDFGINRATVLSNDKKEGNAILSLNGDFLFSSIWKESNNISSIQYGMVFSLFVLSLLFFMTAIQQFVSKLRITPLLVLISSSLLLTFTIIVFKELLVPKILINSEIFSSLTFASSWLINSLGTLLIVNIWVLFLTSSFSNYLSSIVVLNTNNRLRNHILHFLFFLILVILLLVIKIMVSDLIFNSTV